MILTLDKTLSISIISAQRIFALLLLSLVIFLSGCANTHTKSPVISQDWAKHDALLKSKNNWQAIGKLGVKVPNDGGSANLKWTQQSDSYDIDLNGPFGQGKLSISGKSGNVTLIEAGQPPKSAKTAEELITKNTGWYIPVTQLAYWVRGLPAPAMKVTRFKPNAQGLLGELEQADWKVIYGDYVNVTSAGETIAMPGRITAEYKDVKLTLVIREWSFNPSGSTESNP